MIVFIVTFCLFTIEALIHYNYGVNKENNKFVLPDTVNFLKIISTVFLFSILTSLVVRIIEKNF
jgi:hypothetical protein